MNECVRVCNVCIESIHVIACNKTRVVTVTKRFSEYLF